ncbi:OX-2 membrane glycoprotein-like isoform 2-T2 [Odontesthes bonariensis]|uniref:OX-2 membrane glycoprotein-like isoform X2 n=1 Tax=Odontesthes bonariensis TaxID=219752 RepID=UPI003F581B27
MVELMLCFVLRRSPTLFCTGYINSLSEAKLKVSSQLSKKMLLILFVTCFVFKASASQVSGSGSLKAEYGKDAHYRCAVSTQTGVLQITWQRAFNDESVENLATYSNRFGQQVNTLYRGKVIFTEASLNSTSITLRNITWEDEACYICSFNVYPDGSKKNKMCLKVQGISKVNTSHAPTYSGHEEKERQEVFSCSATGKPTPTIEWDFSPGADTINPSLTTTVENSDNTFTSSSITTLKIPADWSGHVDCVLNRGTEGERRERIPLASRGGEEQPQSRVVSAWVIVAVIAVICVVAAVLIRATLKRKGATRDIP